MQALIKGDCAKRHRDVSPKPTSSSALLGFDTIQPLNSKAEHNKAENHETLGKCGLNHITPTTTSPPTDELETVLLEACYLNDKANHVFAFYQRL